MDHEGKDDNDYDSDDSINYYKELDYIDWN